MTDALEAALDVMIVVINVGDVLGAEALALTVVVIHALDVLVALELVKEDAHLDVKEDVVVVPLAQDVLDAEEHAVVIVLLALGPVQENAIMDVLQLLH